MTEYDMEALGWLVVGYAFPLIMLFYFGVYTI